VSLVVLSTHPIQYQAPLYRHLQSQLGIPVTAVYGSDFSVTGYRDQEFGVEFAWDTDLLAGYTSVFLSRSTEGGATSPESVTARGLRATLKRLAPDAILLTGYRPQFNLEAFWAAWHMDCPLLFRAETTDHAHPRGPIQHWVRDRFLRWFYRRFSRLLYIGRRSLEHYQRLGAREQQLVFSPYCVDITSFHVEETDREQYREPTRQSLGLSQERLVLLFSGKLVPRKGPDLLLQAIKQLQPALRQQIVVVFLGDGHLREALGSLANSEPVVDVRFLGFQNQTSLSRYYHCADLLVMPSQVGETWGLVVNEALHHGLPCVVSSSVGCAPDLIETGGTGERFEASSAQGLGQAIQRAVVLAGREQVRAWCRDRVSGYTLERAAEGIAGAYRGVTIAHGEGRTQ
jgi:glycosyltransferase involved in cell wall biosynthesis